MRRAFSLIELLTVVAIIAVLASVLMPVFVQAKKYAQQVVAGQSMAKLTLATTMYSMDSDETFPLAYYPRAAGPRQNWFGIVSEAGEVDARTSLIRPYLKGKLQDDWSLNAAPWMGDKSGFGYNWGYLGSDYYLPEHLSNTIACFNPAYVSGLSDPSGTIEYTTSSFFFAPWIPGGDGQLYRYGFVDPPKTWFGNPTMDFRHMGERKVDLRTREVIFTGQALVVYADGHLKTLGPKQVNNSMFERTAAPRDDN